MSSSESEASDGPRRMSKEELSMILTGMNYSVFNGQFVRESEGLIYMREDAAAELRKHVTMFNTASPFDEDPDYARFEGDFMVLQHEGGRSEAVMAMQYSTTGVYTCNRADLLMIIIQLAFGIISNVTLSPDQKENMKEIIEACGLENCFRITENGYEPYDCKWWSLLETETFGKVLPRVHMQHQQHCNMIMRSDTLVSFPMTGSPGLLISAETVEYIRTRYSPKWCWDDKPGGITVFGAENPPTHRVAEWGVKLELKKLINKDTMRENLDAIVPGIPWLSDRPEADWGVILAGGALESMVRDRLFKDLDFFVVMKRGLELEQDEFCLRFLDQLTDMLAPAHYKTVAMTVSDKIINVSTDTDAGPIKMQFILTPYPSKQTVLAYFDLDTCRICYDGSIVEFHPTAVIPTLMNANIINPYIQHRDIVNRAVAKSCLKNIGVAIPGTRSSMGVTVTAAFLREVKTSFLLPEDMNEEINAGVIAWRMRTEKFQVSKNIGVIKSTVMWTHILTLRRRLMEIESPTKREKLMLTLLSPCSSCFRFLNIGRVAAHKIVVDVDTQAFLCNLMLKPKRNRITMTPLQKISARNVESSMYKDYEKILSGMVKFPISTRAPNPISSANTMESRSTKMGYNPLDSALDFSLAASVMFNDVLPEYPVPRHTTPSMASKMTKVEAQLLISNAMMMMNTGYYAPAYLGHSHSMRILRMDPAVTDTSMMEVNPDWCRPEDVTGHYLREDKWHPVEPFNSETSTLEHYKDIKVQKGWRMTDETVNDEAMDSKVLATLMLQDPLFAPIGYVGNKSCWFPDPIYIMSLIDTTPNFTQLQEMRVASRSILGSTGDDTWRYYDAMRLKYGLRGMVEQLLPERKFSSTEEHVMHMKAISNVASARRSSMSEATRQFSRRSTIVTDASVVVKL